MNTDENLVTIRGNVGEQPDLRATPSGTTNVVLEVATSEQWIDPISQEMIKGTEWHKIFFFGSVADFIIRDSKIKKGTRVYITGYLRTRKANVLGRPHKVVEIIGKTCVPVFTRGDNVNE